MKRRALSLLPLSVLALILIAGCGGGGQTLTILHAGSLAVPLDRMGAAFVEKHPGVDFVTEGAGSRTTIRRVTELGRAADVIGSADYLAIEELMFPDWAEWYIIFATNEMVIAYTPNSKYHEEITADNWYEILLRDGVDYGHSNPNADPAGYRTLMLWQLAETYYDVPGLYRDLDDGRPEKNIRPKETDLIALLQAGELDYAFEYRSLAMQHGLLYLSLPDEIDLSDFGLADYYAQAQVEVSGKEPGEMVTLTGAPIAYGITIPENAPHPQLAIDFVGFLLGSEGQAILQNSGQPPVVPAIASDLTKLPPELRGLVAQGE